MDEGRHRARAVVVRAACRKRIAAKPLGAEFKNDPEQYDAVYLVGGHGTMWDFPDSKGLQSLVASVYNAGGLVGAVCHGPAGLLNVELANGFRLVEGRKVAAFTNDEEVAAGKDKVIPFFLADRLEEQGATHVSADVFEGRSSLTSGW